MNYGCIGEKLTHSFSREIHLSFADYDYELCEIPREELSDFLSRKEFRAINVTIPYKELVMPSLYYIDDFAREIGSVNTIVNRDGRLYGYNTDFYGMRALLSHAKVSLADKKVIILGTGGTSKTAKAVAKAALAKEIVIVSRTAKDGIIDYDELYEKHTDADVIINTTPVGMYPNTLGAPISLDKFNKLSGVIDAIYNPLRTTLISEAIRMGIPAEGGLYMLVAQAVRASEIFTDKTYPEDTTEKVFQKILSEKENIVLVGMPASGKSTVGKILERLTNHTLVDTDDMIVDSAKMEITEIFGKFGETHFRDLESEAVFEAAKHSSTVIATGGGAILREKNVIELKKNGRLFFLDRPKELLIPTDSRPLSSDRDAMEKRYAERYPIYLRVCDERIDASGTPEEVARLILEKIK